MDAGEQGKEKKINDFIVQEKDAAVADHETRVLKTKLHIMQEELDLLSTEYHEKDDEIAKLYATNKELEDVRARLQESINIQQIEIQEQNTSVKELVQRCDDLQLQVFGLSKLVRCYKEEVEKMNCQLIETKQDMKSEELPSAESLLAENKILKKQKTELVVGFKKQTRMIDILKRQMMHLEAAKLLSLTEEEFIKAINMETQ